MTEQNESLKPCPFCGGTAEYDNSDRGPYEWIRCLGCGAQGPTVNYNHHGHTASAAWNERTCPQGVT